MNLYTLVKNQLLRTPNKIDNSGIHFEVICFFSTRKIQEMWWISWTTHSLTFELYIITKLNFWGLQYHFDWVVSLFDLIVLKISNTYAWIWWNITEVISLSSCLHIFSHSLFWGSNFSYSLREILFEIISVSIWHCGNSSIRFILYLRCFCMLKLVMERHCFSNWLFLFFLNTTSCKYLLWLFCLQVPVWVIHPVL